MTFKTFTTILLATSILLFTACDSKVQTDTADEQNTTVQIDNAANTTEEGIIGTTSEENNVNTSTITLNSLKLTINKTTLNKNENTTLKVMATYSDTSTKDVTEDVQWISSQNNAVKVTNHTLTALQDSQTTLQAKLNNVASEAIDLNIYWEVNGYRLPPEPDATVNNSTLLGIDVNDNGVRDDVERWIYEEYKDQHPIYIDIAMQAGRAYKQVLEMPENAKEIREIVNAPLFCAWYYENDSEEFGDPVLVHERIDTKVQSKYFNTSERNNVYKEYDKLLSGGVYDMPKAKERKSFCDFDTSGY